MSLNNREKIIGVFSRTAMAFAIVLAWCGAASASTVAYWPLNYTAAERTTTQTDLTNLGTATELVARPISMIGGTIQEGSSASCPVGTNAFPTGFAVYDPVTSNTLDAATALHFHLPDNRDTEGSGAIRVSNTAALRLTTFTVEFFIRIRQQYTATQMGQYHAVAVMPRILRNGDVVVRNCDSWGIRFSSWDGSAYPPSLHFRFSNATYSFQSGDPGVINTTDYKNLIVKYPDLNDGDWHHVALTVNGTSLIVYIDYRPIMNEEMSQGGFQLANPVSYGTEDLYIGAVPAGAQPFGGDLAHFRISDKVLNAAELLRPVRSARAPDEADDVYLHMSFEQEPGFAAGMYFDRTGSQKVIQRRSGQITPKLDANTCARAIRPSLTNAVAAVNTTSFNNAPLIDANSYLEIRPTSDPFPTSSYTVECFYRAKTINEFSTASIPLVRRLFNAAGNMQFQLALLYNDWALCGSVRQAGHTSGTSILDITPSATNVWHHAAFVVDSDKKIMRLFHDYARVAEQSISAKTASAPPSTDTCLVIAGAPRGGQSNISLNGWVDDVRITLRALEPGEFLSKGYFNPAERTLAWMSFDNGDLNGGPGLTNGVASAGNGGSQPTFPAYPGNTYFVMDGDGNVIRKDTHAISFQKGQVVWAESSLLSLFPAQTVEFFVKANSSTPTAGEAILRNSLFAHTSTGDTSAWLATFDYTYPTHLRLLCATIDDATGAKDGKGINVDTRVVIGDGAWHHIAITFDPSAQGETISVYADYSPTPNWTTTLTGKRIYGKGFGAVWAGAAPTVDKYYFNGQLDEVRISQGVLTPSQFLRKGNVGFMIIIR